MSDTPKTGFVRSRPSWWDGIAMTRDALDVKTKCRPAHEIFGRICANAQSIKAHAFVSSAVRGLIVV